MVTKTLIEHLMATTYEDLPAITIKEAKRSLLNWAGVAIGAAHHPSMDKVLHVANLVGGKQQATILGREEKVDLLFAALLNGMSSHIYDFDDTLLETVLHPSAPVYPAILSYAEVAGKSGKDVLLAFVLGCEVEARLANCLYPSHYWRGWHITGTVGTIGAAAAVAKLLDLDAERFAYAIGLAATEPTGLREMFGTMTKPYHPGKAAMNGLMAALMAEQGFTSSTEALEAKRGYVHVLSDEPKFTEITKAWGATWEIVKNSYKPFASGIVTHPAIDGIIRVQNEYNFKAEDIKSIELEVHPLVKELTGKTTPKTGLEGKFSVYHCVAAGFTDRKASVQQFTDEYVTDEKITAIRDKVTLHVRESIKEDQVMIKITKTDGTIIEHFVEHALGSESVPLTNRQLRDKFHDVTSGNLSETKQAKLIAMIEVLEDLDDLEGFFENCH